MISFIVIGKNEGWKITKCINSIFNTVRLNSVNSFEIIYIDSGSTDDSISRIKKFGDVQIFKITSVPNAAIARNIGAKESKGDVLFFIDGDMEIIPKTFSLIYSIKDGLKADYISGNFTNYYYNQSGDFLYKEDYHNLTKDTYQPTTGGLFIIKRVLWEKMGGMRNIFRKSQDIDFGLRLSKKGILLLRKKEILAIHHTISYTDKNRFIKDALRGNYLFRGLLYKNHVFNKYVFKLYIIREITLAALITSLVLSIVLHSPLILLSYVILLLAKIFYKQKTVKANLFYNMIYNLTTDIMTLISILFYWPSEKKNVTYERIENI